MSKLNPGQLKEVRKLIEYQAAKFGVVKPDTEESTVAFVCAKALEVLEHCDAVEEERDQLQSEIEYVSDSMATDWQELVAGMPEGYGFEGETS